MHRRRLLDGIERSLRLFSQLSSMESGENGKSFPGRRRQRVVLLSPPHAKAKHTKAPDLCCYQ